jgi:NADH dehydrogenase FAD-containing subunit
MALSQSRKRGHRLTDPALPCVIVLGGGFGGLAAVRRLRNEPVRVTWIDRDNHHLFQPLLYQVATGALSPADIAAPLRGIARGCRNIDVVLDEVIGIDPESRTLATMGRSSAVADLGWLRLRGFPAWVVWAAVHIWYLIDSRNRVRVLINWMWLFLTLSPGARLTTGAHEASRQERPKMLRTNLR